MGLLLDVPERVELPNLKVLDMFGILYADDDSVPKLLSGCPVLEELGIIRASPDKVEIYSISVPTLKRLVIIFGGNILRSSLVACLRLKIGYLNTTHFLLDVSQGQSFL